jgi:3-oxoacyl-[acyl-carrier protein] reductase
MITDDLRGKVCLITGSSRGIGAAVARGAGVAGMRVAVHCRSARVEAEQVAADIIAAGGQAIVLQADIAEAGAVERLLAATVAHFGRLDVLINNAGDLIERRPLVETDDAMFEQQIAINVRPVFVACRAAIRQFRAQGGGGAIVNVTSVAARTGGGGGSSLYVGAKAFVSSFTRAIAREVAGEGIRVNAVSPGAIATPLMDRTLSPELQRSTVRAIPMRRIGSPEECVGAFLYLCSDKASSYVTGQVLEVNGGFAMP